MRLGVPVDPNLKECEYYAVLNGSGRGTITVKAISLYMAKIKAAVEFGVKLNSKRYYDVNVVLNKRADGTVVAHNPAEFG